MVATLNLCRTVDNNQIAELTSLTSLTVLQWLNLNGNKLAPLSTRILPMAASSACTCKRQRALCWHCHSLFVFLPLTALPDNIPTPWQGRIAWFIKDAALLTATRESPTGLLMLSCALLQHEKRQLIVQTLQERWQPQRPYSDHSPGRYFCKPYFQCLLYRRQVWRNVAAALCCTSGYSELLLKRPYM